MRKDEFSNWLQQHITDAANMNYINRCQRIEDNLRIDLDDEYIKDNGVSLLERLTYTMDDFKHNRPLRCNILFSPNSNLYNGMGSLKTSASKYFEFCSATPLSTKNSFNFNKKMELSIDSYEQFLNHFNIDKDDFYEWGISSTIFPPIPSVEKNWNILKDRILNNQIVYIRGYGRDAHGTQLYIDLYRELFGNNNICKDPTNNAEPHKLIQRLTGLKRNNNIFNYQVSHIFGHTKNIFLFESPWNICYTPKIMDPFTGHETKGIWPEEYQKLLLIKATELYKPFIEDYNYLLGKYHVARKTDEYLNSLKGIIPDKELKQFAKDVHSELAPIILHIY